MKKFIVLLSLLFTTNSPAKSSLVFEDFDSAKSYFVDRFKVELKTFINNHLDAKDYSHAIYICAAATESCTGNLLLKDIAKHFHEVYSALPSSHKYLMGSISFEILFQNYNARFLKPGENLWPLMEREEAEELITFQFQKAAFEPPRN